MLAGDALSPQHGRDAIGVSAATAVLGHQQIVLVVVVMRIRLPRRRARCSYELPEA
jgi:hypothetical protein